MGRKLATQGKNRLKTWLSGNYGDRFLVKKHFNDNRTGSAILAFELSGQ